VIPWLPCRFDREIAAATVARPRVMAVADLSPLISRLPLTVSRCQRSPTVVPCRCRLLRLAGDIVRLGNRNRQQRAVVLSTQLPPDARQIVQIGW